MSKIFTLAALLYFTMPAWGQAGSLNPQFNGGTVITGFGPNHSQADDLAVQPDGKVIAAGYALISGISNFALARYNTNGTLDNSFGVNGKVLVNLGSGSWLKAIALQADGKIVVGGSVTNGPTVQFALMRFLSNGSPDPSFGTNGVVTLIIGSYAYVKDIVLQPDGKIIMSGEAYINGDYDFAIARYNTNGTLDISFGGGVVIIDFNNDDYVKAVRVQSDGKVVVAGSSNFKFALTRLTPSGSLDNEFGSEGRVTTIVGSVPGNDNALSLALQTDGKIILAGEAFNPPHASDVALVRYTPSGSLDPTFGNNGKILTDIGGNFDQASAVAIQGDGKIVVAANTTYNGQPRIGMLRYTPQGNSDPSFGNNGVTITTVGNEAYVSSMQFHGLGIYVAGVAKNNPDRFAILSFINDASPLPVRLVDFTAQKVGNSVVLNWITENELNTESFHAEKSTDGRIFNLLQEVAAAGNSTTTLKYSAIDRQPFAAVNYYLIRTVDIDGSSSYSKIVAIKNDIKAIEVFPNPVAAVTQLQLPAGIHGALRIDILDAGGMLTKTMNLQSAGNAQSIPVDLSYLSRGTYILRVTGANTRFSQKLIKE